MRFFIDSADIDEIREAVSWGLVDGITTNPSLIKKAVQKHGSEDMEGYIQNILETAGDMPVSLEVIGTSHQEMTEEASTLFRKFKDKGNVVIKIPVNTAESDDEEQFEGIRTIKKLSEKGIPVNVTLIMNPEQALVAAKAGARYVSPFAGRVDDFLRKKQGVEFKKDEYYEVCKNYHDQGVFCGIQLVEDIRDIFNNYEFECEIISASLRNPRQVRECALAGSDISTVPFAVLRKMLSHEKTQEGIKKFKEDVVPEYKELF